MTARPASLKWRLAQKLEITWWKRYLADKSPEDYLRWKKSYWTDFLEKIEIRVSTSATVLDAGCGPAGIFTILENSKVTAVDPLLEQYNFLPHFQKEKYPYVQFIDAPLETAELPKFDYVFCLNVINHVADIEKSLDKITESVTPKGKLILSIDTHNYLFFKYLFRLIPGDALHPHQYDLREYSEMLTKRGFKIERTVLIKEEFFFNYWVLVASKL